MLAKLRNRGVKDVLFVCCDGLNGLPRGNRGRLALGESADLRRAPDPLLTVGLPVIFLGIRLLYHLATTWPTRR